MPHKHNETIANFRKSRIHVARSSSYVAQLSVNENGNENAHDLMNVNA